SAVLNLFSNQLIAPVIYSQELNINWNLKMYEITILLGLKQVATLRAISPFVLLFHLLFADHGEPTSLFKQHMGGDLIILIKNNTRPEFCNLLQAYSLGNVATFDYPCDLCDLMIHVDTKHLTLSTKQVLRIFCELEEEDI
ncbi:hypothetical protein ACJX0J_011168, partial [Zea mays]